MDRTAVDWYIDGYVIKPDAVGYVNDEGDVVFSADEVEIDEPYYDDTAYPWGSEVDLLG